MKRRMTMMAGMFFILALVLALSGCGEEKPPPTNALDDASKKMKEVKSARIDYDLDIEMSGDFAGLGAMTTGMTGTTTGMMTGTTGMGMAESMQLSLGISGTMEVDNNDPDQPKAKGTLELEGMDELFTELAGVSGDAEAMAGMDMMSDMFGSMELIVTGDKAYIKLDETWYETDASGAEALTGVGTLPIDTSASDSECMQKELQAPDRFLISSLLADVQELSGEKIDGTETRHFKAKIDTSKLIDELIAVSRECGDDESVASLEDSKADLANLFSQTEVELWIDGDNYIRQIRLNMDVDLAELVEAGGDALGADEAAALEEGRLKISGTIKFSAFGEKFDISAPPNPQPMENLVNDIFGLGMTEGFDMGDFEDMEGFDTMTIPEDMFTVPTT